MLFWCIPAFYATKLRNAGKTHYLCKELIHVKNGLFWCILAFYATNSEMQANHYFLLKRLIFVFLRCFMKKILSRLETFLILHCFASNR
ncbi:hypothetical protein E2C01_033593 [Portunus trituberculatus]|uniref:Uncharacterized protein n=1 Tax=Portunus trituberculatus TaxID=210409 RepID=A0A5B7EYB7_PORTR|nr:hypothetical protein [Portunus trituberculatus]